MLDLRQLRYFVAVAEVEHVGKAAETLHISQSPLSRQIAQLEERLGLQLFERSQQRLRLTSDGRTFLHEAKALLKHAERLESLGRRLGRGETGGLCIGYVSHAIHAGVLPEALRHVREERPGIHIALYNLSAQEQFEGLRQRSLDVALVCEPPADDDPDLLAAPVFDDPLHLALPLDHPLADKPLIEPADLHEQDWIMVEGQLQPNRRERFLASCVAAGFTPQIRLEAAEPLSAIGLVSAGLGLALIQQSIGGERTPNVVLRELPWLGQSTGLWAAWHRVDLRPIVADFREMVLAGASV
ncbi:LysR family transcriptional regulator [Pseudomonas sp. PDM23]|uniref:LysR substrate-binding domain-containing protein n=1 Tax=unclassified Pseudomonas TaxID=196821 RepID=UPI00177EA578|nr:MULTISPECIES: LysR substrate-binding domain-containing protein [unclassified Pseudomonas]MBD9579658.1 LysR family transcriptional regulator [Pseudomonas sp. PDM23]MBD9674967.1 LysR family transcriptional regulator [Pseudomonas sp. PDM21]